MAAFTITKWIRVFPAILTYGCIGGVITTVQGHALNHPEIPVDFLQGAAMTALLASTAVVSMTFVDKTLTVVDKISVLGFLMCVFWQAVQPRLMLPALLLGLALITLAWIIDRTRRTSVAN